MSQVICLLTTVKPHWSSVSGVVLRGNPNPNPDPLAPGLCMCWYLLNCFSLTAQLAKTPVCNMGDPGSIPGLGRYPGEGIGDPLQSSWASLVAQLVKNLPAMRETWVQYPGWEDPLEKGKATHSSILAWRIPWTVHGVAKSQTRLSYFHFALCIQLILILCFSLNIIIIIISDQPVRDYSSLHYCCASQPFFVSLMTVLGTCIFVLIFLFRFCHFFLLSRI